MRVILLFLTAVIPGLYHMATGAPLRGALIFALVTVAGNTVLLLCLLPPFWGQGFLVVAAIVGASVAWAGGLLASVRRYANLSGVEPCQKS